MLKLLVKKIMFRLLFFGCVFCTYFSYSQSIYLHTDRTIYAARDTIWFKAYLFDAQSWLPAPDQTFYVQLLDVHQKTVAQRILISENGAAANFIPLPDSLKGTYQLVAFTRQQADEKSSIHSKTICIFKNTPFSQISNSDSLKIDLQFLPESGHLVEGIPSIVAFRAIDQGGLPVGIAGRILNQNQEEIISFKEEFKGMGRFLFSPQPDQEYHANINFQGKKYIFKLPLIEKQGVVLRISHQENDSLVIVKIFQKYTNYQPLTLKISAQGEQLFTRPIQGKEVNNIKFSKKLFTNGIIQFSVLKDSVVLAERLVCVNRESSLTIETLGHRDSVNQFVDETTIEISPRSKNGELLTTGDFSVSITDVEQDNTENLVSTLFLEADIKEPISEPAYYFDTSKPNSYQHLDLLLLTLGWTSYKWKEKQVVSLIEKAPIILGRVLNYTSKKNAGKVKITYQYGSKVGQTEGDINGNFKIENHGITQDMIVYIQARKRNYDLFEIQILENIPKVALQKAIFEPKENIENTKLIQQLKAYVDTTGIQNEVELEEVIVRAKREISPEAKKIINELGMDLNSGIDIAMQSSREIINDSPEISSLPKLITNKIVETDIISVIMGLDAPFPIVYHFLSTVGPPPLGFKPVAVFLNKKMICFLCKQEVLNATIDAREVAKLIYFRSTEQNVSSVVLITKNAIPNYDYSKDKTVGNLLVRNLGTHIEKSFYIPKYAQQNTPLPKKATLYWSPFLKPNENGKFIIKLHHRKDIENLKITIEGTDGKGKIGSFKGVVN